MFGNSVLPFCSLISFFHNLFVPALLRWSFVDTSKFSLSTAIDLSSNSSSLWLLVQSQSLSALLSPLASSPKLRMLSLWSRNLLAWVMEFLLSLLVLHLVSNQILSQQEWRATMLLHRSLPLLLELFLYLLALSLVWIKWLEDPVTPTRMTWKRLAIRIPCSLQFLCLRLMPLLLCRVA